MEVKATAKQIRVSPRKVRLIIEDIRGRRIDEAMARLKFMQSPHARTVAKVVKSAAANAENNFQMVPEDLRIVKAYADPGPMLKRFRPRSHGRVSPILKRTSHITVIVDERP